MAFPTKLLFIALLSLVHTHSASAQTPVNSNVTLAGVVTCINTSIATAKTYSVIPQAKVDIVCGLLPLVIRSTTSNYAGIYSFAFTPLDILLSNPELCQLKVTIQSNSCTFDPPGGVLRLPIIGIRSGLGLVVDYITGAPSYTPF